jgi:hypothetical protein
MTNLHDLDFEPVGVMPDNVPDFDAPIVHSSNGNGQHAPVSLLETALSYAREGDLCVMPGILPAKSPVEKWPDEIPPDDIIRQWFSQPNRVIGYLTGKRSYYAEMIDHESAATFEQWAALVERNAPGLIGRLVIETTLHGGRHVHYRCETIGGNDKLAKTKRSIPGHKPDKAGDITLIETRGEGGFVVCYPTKDYNLLQGDLHDIPTISPAERDVLIECARMLDETHATPAQPSNTPERSAVYDILTRAGWTLAGKQGGVEQWKRPGTDAHHSATWNYTEGRFHVFSSNAAPFEEGKRYTLAQVQALLEPDATPAQAWRLYSMRDARTPRAPLCFIVEALIVAASLVIFYGAPGTLKSMLLAELAVCVAAGLPWLAALPGESGLARRVTQMPVLWCDFDNGTRRTHERFDAIGRAHAVPDDIPLYYVSMPSPWLDASAIDSITRLADQIREINAGLVVIDNLGTVTGQVDENSAEMINVMAHLRWLAEFTGAAVVVVHHQRKANGLQGRAGETLRGHSSIEAALDLALLVERETGASLVSVRSTKTRDVDVTPFGAQFTFEHKDGSKELQAARFYGVMVEDTTSDQAIERAIIEAVTQHHPVNQTKLANAVKDVLPEIGSNRIRQLANKMVSKKRLTSNSGAHGARLYDLP